MVGDQACGGIWHHGVRSRLSTHRVQEEEQELHGFGVREHLCQWTQCGPAPLLTQEAHCRRHRPLRSLPQVRTSYFRVQTTKLTHLPFSATPEDNTAMELVTPPEPSILVDLRRSSPRHTPECSKDMCVGLDSYSFSVSLF